MDIVISINEWVGVSEDGIWISMFDDDKASWKTKKELLDDISDAKLDAARKVKRISAGEYNYIPKCCDTGRYNYASTYALVKLTQDNIQHYRQLLADTLENDEY